MIFVLKSTLHIFKLTNVEMSIQAFLSNWLNVSRFFSFQVFLSNWLNVGRFPPWLIVHCLMANVVTTMDTKHLHSPSTICQSSNLIDNNFISTPLFDTASLKNQLSTTFASLGISKDLLDKAKAVGFKHPREVQAKAIPQILKGKNVLVKAKTGSGKTATFALPILHTLLKDPYGIYALILTPTRELAMQIYEQVAAFTTIELRLALIVGGVPSLPQILALEARPHVVIATPGRLAEHMQNETVQKELWSNLKYLILDESDRLVEETFTEQIQTIIDTLPIANDRQTLLFSATMTKNFTQLKQLGLDEATIDYIEIQDNSDALVASLDQRYVLLPQHVKEAYLVHLLQQFENKSAIIFVATCRAAEIVTEMLIQLKFTVESLHSRKSQNRRTASLQKFRAGMTKLLVATDVASRGLDIPSVELVINYDIPRVIDDYIHRVGRTARSNRTGLSLTLVSQYDVKILQAIETHVQRKMDEYSVNEDRVLDILKDVNSAKRFAKIKLQDYEDKDRGSKYHKLRVLKDKALKRVKTS